MPASLDSEALRFGPDEIDEMLRRTLTRSAAISARHRHRRKLLGGLAVGPVVAAVVSVVVLGRSRAAFAGWSAAPTTPTATQSSATQDNCQASLATMPGGGQGSWSQVATDVRGPYTVAIYENDGSFATCFTGPSFTVASFSSANGEVAMQSASSATAGSPGSGSTSTDVVSPGGGIDQLAVSHLSLSGNGPYTLAEGRLDSTVSAVTLVLSDGQDVTATTLSGWFVAW